MVGIWSRNRSEISTLVELAPLSKLCVVQHSRRSNLHAPVEESARFNLQVQVQKVSYSDVSCNTFHQHIHGFRDKSILTIIRTICSNGIILFHHIHKLLLAHMANVPACLRHIQCFAFSASFSFLFTSLSILAKHPKPSMKQLDTHFHHNTLKRCTPYFLNLERSIKYASPIWIARTGRASFRTSHLNVSAPPGKYDSTVS